jgi:outer membrane lipoprotein-sorting protein
MKKPKKIIISVIIIAIFFSGCVGEEDGKVPVQPTIDEPKINEAAQKVVDMAKNDLAEILSISITDIKLSKIEEMTWPTSSLGYPNPDEQYLQVETPGYKIFLSYNNELYEYHSDFERVVSPPPGTK